MLALPQTVTDEIAGFVVKLPLQGHLFSQQTLKWSHKCHPLNQLAYPKKQFVHDNTSILSVHSKYLSSEWQKWIKIVMVLLYLKLWRVWGNCIVPSTNKIQNSTKFSVLRHLQQPANYCRGCKIQSFQSNKHPIFYEILTNWNFHSEKPRQFTCPLRCTEPLCLSSFAKPFPTPLILTVTNYLLFSLSS